MGDRKSVLVIEDMPAIREALCTVLESDGYDVSGCDDGTSALAAAAEKDFQVIITDFRMPKMNGVEVTRYLRTRFPLSVIIGMSSDDKMMDFLVAGADAFLLKPYQYDDLTSIINSM